MPTKTIILDLNDRNLLTMFLPADQILNIYFNKKLIHSTETEPGEQLELRLPYEFGPLKKIVIKPLKTKTVISAHYPNAVIKYEVVPNRNKSKSEAESDAG